MSSKVYKWCAVPECTNSSARTPNKLFVYVPHSKTMRNKWLNLAQRDPNSVKQNSPIYFCEDHFDLPNDMSNYMEYHLMGSVSQVRMKPGCIPTKFDCLSHGEKRKSSTTKTSVVNKRSKLGANKPLDDGDVSSRSPVSETNEEANESKQIVIKDQKACQANLFTKSMCIATTFICNRFVYTDRCEAEIQVEIAPTLQAESCCKKNSVNKSTITEDKYFVISTTKYEPIFRSEPVALPTIKIEPLTGSDKESETTTIKIEPATESEEFTDSRTIKTEPATESYEPSEMSTVDNDTETHKRNIFEISTVKIEPD